MAGTAVPTRDDGPNPYADRSRAMGATIVVEGDLPDQDVDAIDHARVLMQAAPRSSFSE
jgi:hypothetical protein